ncbi:phage tail length tape measure family protein [Methylocystis sp. JR02]|uniref:phage tail length tape measure family protein n=1 Tax=Methylocystis sp. JR02 TaxID=3046284 RepID=UPI0024BA06FF|nr:phage tail length tape measure family protein [Methylocystis sp. JR02]MDJ0449249.1 phage tail length tape measure family protein [Methylocystis sp. JR02]
MADAVVGSLTYRFRADTNDLRRGMEQTQAQLRSMADQARAASSEMRRGMEESTRAVALTRYEMLNLNRQIADVAVSLASGQSPFLVLIQQGAQIKDIFDANGTGLRGFASTLASIFTPARIAILAAASAATTLGGGAHQASQELADVADKARLAGLSVQTFLGAQILGARVGLDIDKVRAALANAGKEFEAFKRNEGGVKDTLDKIDASFLGVADKARNAGEFIDIIARKIQELPRTEGMQLGEKLFGTEAAQRFFDVIRNGEFSMRKLAETAGDGAKNVDQVAEASRKMQNEIAEAARVSDTKLLVAFGRLSDPVSLLVLKWQQLKALVADVATAIQKDFKAASTAVDRVVEAQKILAQPHQMGGEAASSVFDRMRGGQHFGRLIPVAESGIPGTETAGESRARYQAREDAAKAARSHGSPGNATKEAKDAIADYIKTLHEAQKLAEAEAGAWDKGNVEREKALAIARAENIAKREGKTLTEAERKEIEATAAATASYKDNVDELLKKQEQLNDVMREFGDFAARALEDLATRARSAREVLADLVKLLGSNLLRGALTGDGMFGGLFGGGNGQTGGLGGIFSSMLSGVTKSFGGLFANGGNLPAGRWGIVGEKGPELISGPANVTPLKQLPPTSLENSATAPSHVFNFHFPPGTDVQSFRRSQGQLSAMVARAVAGGQRNL